MPFEPTRVRRLNEAAAGAGPVVYWMQRDQRVQENWALLYAQQEAVQRKVPLVVIFVVLPTLGDSSWRHYAFMFQGLQEITQELQALNISFVALAGDPAAVVPEYLTATNAGELVTDFSPLREPRHAVETVAQQIKIKFSEVDAHNIVPCWVASNKLEYAAYTFRPKVLRKLPEYLTNFPELTKHPVGKATTVANWAQLEAGVLVTKEVPSVSWITPGPKAAKAALTRFIKTKLDGYSTDRNDPTRAALSNLSPYLHFGHLSAQHIVNKVVKAFDASKESRDMFIEELVVRRELADNYCFYNPFYDTVAAAPLWARKTITQHKKDEREYVYTLEEFEMAKTHDDLWNAMQTQMVLEGKMHGWCRMYWAKKILEWTESVPVAIRYALYLNDKYELDGTDPNGVVGVMWSMCGVHDRAWPERPVFGQVRYINYAGAKRKFDIKAFVEQYSPKISLFK